MNPDSAHTSQWAIGETIFGLPLVAAITLQWLFPIFPTRGGLRLMLLAVGLFCLVAGWAFIALARKELSRQNQPTDPGHPTEVIVTTGVFSISRNPMYAGCALFMVGLAFALNNPYMIIAILVAILLCEWILIRPEERYLQRKFGDVYLAYSNHVHRWIGKKS